MSEKVNYKFEGRKLELLVKGEEKDLEFDYPIRQVIAFKDLIFIRLEPDIGSICNENVFCASYEGEILWQVQPIPHVYEDAPITGMAIHGDKLKLYSWDGVDITVDPFTGKVIKKEFTK